MLLFKPLIELCEEISAVGRFLSEESKNPYFLFLSPMKKFEIYQWNNQFKKSLFENTQYFDPETEELNQDYFLYRVNTVGELGSKVNNSILYTLCIFAMLKSLKLDKKMLYDAAIKNPIIRTFEERGFGIVAH